MRAISPLAVPAGPAMVGAACSDRSDLLGAVHQLILTQQYETALERLQNVGSSPAVQNLRGICFMRLGQFDAAVRLYRSFVLKHDCTWTRPDLPDVDRINFATALLLDGHPAGCLSILAEVRNHTAPGIQKIHESLERWMTTLNWWQRLNWRLGRVEPNAAPPSMKDPGELPEGAINLQDLRLAKAVSATAGADTGAQTVA